MSSQVDEWTSRIKGYGSADPASLVPHPENWRTHPQRQQDALSKLLDEVGWVRSVIVNQTTGRLVDGHLRVGLAVARGEQLVPVVYVELDEQEERVILANLDPIATLAATDTAALMALAGSVSIEHPEQTDVMALLKELTGMRSQSGASAGPTQEQIARQSTELELRFGARHLDSHAATCPKCKFEFEFAK
jgi:hypothetical protein